MTRDAGPERGGRFITLEGPDGSGKTSQAEALRDRLARSGVPVTVVREPGGTPVGERIRSMLLENGTVSLSARADALLFNAARAELVAQVIRPALARGDTVVSARFADSTLAYQGYGAGLAIDDLRAMERFATGGLRPDLTVVLDLPVEVGLGRKAGTEITRFEANLDLAFHRRVREGFLALAAAEPERFVVVDAGMPPAAVLGAVVDAVTSRFPELPDLAGPAVTLPPPTADETAAGRTRITR